jgi:hypothetical protein
MFPVHNLQAVSLSQRNGAEGERAVLWHNARQLNASVRRYSFLFAPFTAPTLRELYFATGGLLNLGETDRIPASERGTHGASLHALSKFSE